MKRAFAILFVLTCAFSASVLSQSNNSTPYCHGGYNSGQCNQPNASNNPGNSINDFINDFITTGGNQNISNTNSGCNGLNNNYAYYGCEHYLSASQGQTISCTLRSGITFDQSFAIFIDWNQDNTFQNPGEMVAFTGNAIAAFTWTTITFVIPSNQANGTYRMRVRCAYFINGNTITPCSTHSHGETEDYNLYIGTTPPGVITATASSPNPTVCAGTQVSLNISYTGTVVPTFTWAGPGGYTSNLQNPVLTSTGQAQSGVYTATVSNNACPVTVTVPIRVVNYPSFTVTPSSPVICQGGQFFAFAQLPLGQGTQSFFFNWAPATGAGTVFSALASSTSITPLPLPVTQTLGTVIYSITVTPTIHACPVQKTLTVTINNPLTPTLNLPAPLCNIFAPVQLTGVPGGGTWTANSAVAAGGQLTPSLAAIGVNTVMYSVTQGTCTVSNTGTFSISKFHTPALTSSLNLVCVQDPAINLMNLVQDTVTGKWSGQSVSQNRYFNPQGLPTGVYTFSYNTWSTPVASVCPSSTVLNVPVFNPPVPVIAPIQPTCNIGPTVQLTASPGGGTWSNNGGVSISGVQTPSLNSNGSNTVTYTAGQGTCVASSSRTFHVSNFNSAALKQPLLDLCVTAGTINLMGVAQGTTGTWSGVTINNNIFNTTGLPTNNYTVTYKTTSNPDPALCPDQSALLIHVLNPPAPNIISAGPYCTKDGTVQLSASPPGGIWVAQSYVTPSGLFTASLAPVGQAMVQYVTGTPTCSAQQTRFVSVEAFVPASLTLKQLPDICNTSAPISLLPYSISSTGTWYGSGLQGATFNPSKSGAGNFVLTYSTSSYPSGLCPDASTLAVQVFSLAPPRVSQAGPFCTSSAPVQLTVNPVGGVFEGANTHAVNSSGLFIPPNASVGNNIISYSITSGPCIAFAQATVSVEKFVPATLNRDDLTFCRNNSPFNLDARAINVGGLWSGGAVVNGNMFDPSRALTGAANTVVYTTHSHPTATLCPDSRTLQVRVDDIPVIRIASSKTEGCAPHEVLLNLPNTNSGTGEWNFGDGTPNRTGLALTHVYDSPGTYSVTFNYSVGACYARTTLSQPIRISEAPVADFDLGSEELTISDARVQALNKTRNIESSTYLWQIQGQQDRREVHPRLEFQQAGTYKVTLTATSPEGCSSEKTRYVEVKNDFEVYIPNSFSPNYDGINDKFAPIFTPYGLNEKSFEMEIFDRWGHLVYRTTDVSRGWDGTFQNKGDTPLKEGVYVFRIRFRDLEGKAHQKSGTVSMLAGK
jgi:gliding motility-associated-like protein